MTRAALAVHFTVREQQDGEWALVAHRDNGDAGNYAGIGALNGEVEAKLVCKSLNASLRDPVIHDKWRDYFDA